MTIAALSGKGALSLHRALLLGFSVVVICVSVLIGHAELAREKAALDDILNRHVAAGEGDALHDLRPRPEHVPAASICGSSLNVSVKTSGC